VSQSHLEPARSALRAFEQRDMNAIEELCTPGIEFVRFRFYQTKEDARIL
jgi:hypothetical protein